MRVVCSWKEVQSQSEGPEIGRGEGEECGKGEGEERRGGGKGEVVDSSLLDPPIELGRTTAAQKAVL